ncbi:alpha/beta fold hydrolase [[Clostridium] innocuum]|nr:alpha/beta fold hydrolase [[Clostridium] innocuum]
MKYKIILIVSILLIVLSIFWIDFNDKNEKENSLQIINVQQYSTKEFEINYDDKRIYGQLYLPLDTKEKYPLVIISHGLGGNYETGADYAMNLAKQGYAVYCFDFRGGSASSKSSGSTLEMSLFTEQDDLNAVIDTLKKRSFIDEKNIFLMGTSQGGAVSAITAAKRKDIQGMILLYPAFVLVDMAQEQFESVDDIPETYQLLWLRVGRVYAEKLLDYDIYEEIKKYQEDVLILHGDEDDIVPLSYSQKALDTYPSARLHILHGAGHGFYGSDATQAIDYILEYLAGNLEKS